MNIIILIFALIGSFIIVKKLSINTYNMIKYKFDVQKLIDNNANKINKVKEQIKEVSTKLGDKAVRICGYTALGISWASILSLLYKAFC
jgi:hypothetical protein